MRKLLLIIVSIASYSCVHAASTAMISNPPESRSFMFTRPGYAHLNMIYQEWQNIIYDKRGESKTALQVIPFYQGSMSWQETAEYFLIDDQSELLVAGDANTDILRIRDVRAEWVNLPAEFEGTMAINPLQQQWGCYFFYNKDIDTFLNKLTGTTFFDGWQITFSLPVVRVVNEINLTQYNVKNIHYAPGQPNSIIEAFDQPSWQYGVIQNGKHKRIGIGEITLTAGSSYLCHNYFLIEYHTAFTFPGSHKQRDKVMFEPVVGTNGHAGIGGGVTFQLLLNDDISRYRVCGYFALDSLFLIHSKQMRTFDLVSKPWARFMLYNRKYGPPNQNIPGVNVLSREALIRPLGRFDFVTGFRIMSCGVTFDFGYSMWGHDAEIIQHLYPPCHDDIFGIAAVQDPLDPVAYTASKSTIDSLAPIDIDNDGNRAFVAITDDDIDFLSGASGSAFNQKAHFSVGATHRGVRCDGFAGIGFFADIPIKKGALKTWGLWGKFGASF